MYINSHSLLENISAGRLRDTKHPDGHPKNLWLDFHQAKWGTGSCWKSQCSRRSGMAKWKPTGRTMSQSMQHHSTIRVCSFFTVPILCSVWYKWRYHRRPCAVTFNNTLRPTVHGDFHKFMLLQISCMLLRKAAVKRPPPPLCETNCYDFLVLPRLVGPLMVRHFGSPNTGPLKLVDILSRMCRASSLSPVDQGTLARSYKFQADDGALLKWLQKENVKPSGFKNWRCWSANRPTKTCPKCVLLNSRIF